MLISVCLIYSKNNNNLNNIYIVLLRLFVGRNSILLINIESMENKYARLAFNT